MKILYALLLLVSVQIALAGDPCGCKDIKGTHHYRHNQKHETDYEKFPKAKDAIASQDIIGWQKRYVQAMKATKSKSLDQPRKKNTPEDSLYTLKGYIWYVKHEKSGKGADCDFHIEIGTKNRSGRRVVVEVTKDNCRLQQEILDTMQSHGFSLKKEFDQGIPCTVVGLGFYDGVHPPSGHGRKGKTTFSSWELHPVKSIMFE
jgi:hypothetical protein